jgi:hypothetical protein
MQPVSTRISFAAAERAFHQRAAGVDKRPAVALKALHDEALAAEQADAELPLEGDADADALGGGEKRVLLRDQLAADLGEMDRHDFPRIGRAERHLPALAGRFMKTVMNSDSPVSRRLPAPISAPMNPPCCCEPSPKIVSISIPSSMYIMPPASATGRFVRIQLHFDELHVVAEDLVVDLMHPGHQCPSCSLRYSSSATSFSLFALIWRCRGLLHRRARFFRSAHGEAR